MWGNVARLEKKMALSGDMMENDKERKWSEVDSFA